MTPSVRRVAVIGGNRIPFARSNGPYAHASNSDFSRPWGMKRNLAPTGNPADMIALGARTRSEFEAVSASARKSDGRRLMFRMRSAAL